MNPVLDGILFRAFELFCAALLFSVAGLVVAFAAAVILSFGKIRPPKDDDDFYSNDQE